MDSVCTAVTSSGVKFQEISCLYPPLGWITTSWEKNYDATPVIIWMQGQPLLPLTAVALYALCFALGEKFMKNRESFKWRNILALWNLALALFSFVGFCRTFPQLFHNMLFRSLRDNFCMNAQAAYGSGSSGLWVQLFIWSKFPELVDTFFIVVHKKKLIFLHWYHHITVLLYCWHSYVTMSPVGLFFVVMNYAVHSMMYAYYFLMAAKLKPKWLNPMFITGAQISQMIVGVAVTTTAFQYFREGDNTCNIQRENNTAAFLMYGSYLVLFVKFFFIRFGFGIRTPKIKRV